MYILRIPYLTKVSSICAIIGIDYVVFVMIYLYLDIEIIQRIK